ncbi:DUF3168 domain-containing protein [Planctomonas sp. JC2975]|uniref:tail completion protein gp17 n=1 Tax=Planctomonas sp. JC2975 TaxID=2729626 RepID=UPI001475CDDA|nr:DUF3168 domain-containing protein [Planctomonas sp. JC2975]NNC10695.1 DUF3168 domain-containing protein [Planctomonas sp. JC2975]
MPNPIVAIPDDELALLQYLKARPEVLALIPATQLSSDMPASPVYPIVLVNRAGGTAHDRAYIDEPALQVDVMASTKRAAKQLTNVVRSAILAIANDVVAEGTLVSAAEEVGPGWLPDTISVPPVPRYTARYQVLLHK